MRRRPYRVSWPGHGRPRAVQKNVVVSASGMGLGRRPPHISSQPGSISPSLPVCVRTSTPAFAVFLSIRQRYLHCSSWELTVSEVMSGFGIHRCSGKVHLCPRPGSLKQRAHICPPSSDGPLPLPPDPSLLLGKTSGRVGQLAVSARVGRSDDPACCTAWYSWALQIRPR